MKKGKREEIMEAALAIIAEQGFHDAPMAEIAEKAGVAAGTIYRYFESKEVLISELHRSLEETIGSELLRGYQSTRPLRERFLYLLQGVIRYFIAHPFHFRFLEQYFNSPFGIARHRDVLMGKPGKHDILMDIFKVGRDQQVLKELPTAALFALAFGPMVVLIRDHIQGFVMIDDVLIGRVSGACWDAIKR